ncbi:type VI secretion protein [Pandoraea cepalis]|uniref:Type VI secretion protein n=1 Tax=Pandoraea cepalis TaxID=2508294 RepID=A0AAW7MGN9_9BURK|nr:TraE/TraK family type IV conjugative transfer system protein [Pandoraea cepalis]MDN4571865.1 type VI secretion protein [Pandoraea cepalis]MDN4581319.1 type VI secretion protein [Pandoraea cepalis]
MDIGTRNKSVAELSRDNRRLTAAVALIAVAMLVLSLKTFFTNEIIVNQVPGMPNGAKIEKNGMDVGAKQAIVIAVTTMLASVNPSNAESIKHFIQPFTSPEAYTKVSKAIDDKVATLRAQRELGSYYFVTRGFDLDEKLGLLFVKGDLHTVNAAKDTSEPWVFEYPVSFSNYQMVINDVVSYPGDRVRNSKWIEAQTKK